MCKLGQQILSIGQCVRVWIWSKYGTCLLLRIWYCTVTSELVLCSVTCVSIVRYLYSSFSIRFYIFHLNLFKIFRNVYKAVIGKPTSHGMSWNNGLTCVLCYRLCILLLASTAWTSQLRFWSQGRRAPRSSRKDGETHETLRDLIPAARPRFLKELSLH